MHLFNRISVQIKKTPPYCRIIPKKPQGTRLLYLQSVLPSLLKCGKLRLITPNDVCSAYEMPQAAGHFFPQPCDIHCVANDAWAGLLHAINQSISCLNIWSTPASLPVYPVPTLSLSARPSTTSASLSANRRRL